MITRQVNSLLSLRLYENTEVSEEEDSAGVILFDSNGNAIENMHDDDNARNTGGV